MTLDTIYNEDCLKGMERIPDGSVDMILCDLPYGTTRNKWDSVIPLDRLWEQYQRIAKKNAAIVLTAQIPFSIVLGASNLKCLKYEWIWGKDQGTGHLNANRAPLKSHENILLFSYGSPMYHPQMRAGFAAYVSRTASRSTNYDKFVRTTTVSNGERYPVTIIGFSRDNSRLHPTQKPVALFEYLIRTYTNQGETVLDNCMGSGTTAIACMNTGRRYIGFETDKGYYDASLKRIASHFCDKQAALCLEATRDESLTESERIGAQMGELDWMAEKLAINA